MEYHILVCEDEKEIADAIEIYLKNQGYVVHKAANGKEGMVLNRTLYQRKIKKNCKIKKPMDGALCRIQLHNVPSFIWLYRSYGL